jgi:hypothetical protein
MESKINLSMQEFCPEVDFLIFRMKKHAQSYLKLNKRNRTSFIKFKPHADIKIFTGSWICIYLSNLHIYT